MIKYTGDPFVVSYCKCPIRFGIFDLSNCSSFEHYNVHVKAAYPSNITTTAHRTGRHGESP